ncbi:LytR C-terminal domain-containing protein [Patescibacteria group bacterium]|nr:LytR C-terminal domain-containing protein [Patescibacteria group bacterium]MBU1457479.1 LytR C-terminal domain-containing protein [Patescibacteria group bacterium]
MVFLAHNQSSLGIETLVSIASTIKQKYNLKIKGIIISGDHIDKSIDVPAQWEVVKKNINIMATAAKKNKTITKDQDELEIKPASDPVAEPEPKAEVVEPVAEVESVTEPVVDTTPIPNTPEIKFDQEPSEKNDVKTKSNKGLFMALAITLVVGGALTGGILYSRSATNNQDIRSKANETPEAVVTETVTETPTPTPEELDLTEYTLQIQNGSGTAGQAGAVDEILQAEGFNEADTTNADSYDYQDTEVQLKADTPKAVYDTIERALNSDYDVKLGDALEEDSEFDVVIIVGQKI